MLVYFRLIQNNFEVFNLVSPQFLRWPTAKSTASQIRAVRELVNLLLAVMADKNAIRDYGNWGDLELSEVMGLPWASPIAGWFVSRKILLNWMMNRGSPVLGNHHLSQIVSGNLSPIFRPNGDFFGAKVAHGSPTMLVIS
jgi:hypothetical protein